MTYGQSLDDNVSVVTGASSGIGLETAHGLAQEGSNIVLAARRKKELESLSTTLEKRYEVETVISPTNVRKEKEVVNLLDLTIERFGRLDLLVNNAGVLLGGDIESLTTSEYRKMMETNIDGTFFTTRESLPYLKDSEGTLIFIGSFAGKFPRSSSPVYAATKWWIRGFADSVAAQSGDENVAVSVINPTEVRTEIGSDMGDDFEERFEKAEFIEPEEVAKAVVYAARQENGMVAELDLYRRDRFALF